MSDFIKVVFMANNNANLFECYHKSDNIFCLTKNEITFVNNLKIISDDAEKYMASEITQPFLDTFINKFPATYPAPASHSPLLQHAETNETELFYVSPSIRIERILFDPNDFSPMIKIYLGWFFRHKKWCEKFCSGGWRIKRNTICFENIEDCEKFKNISFNDFCDETKW